MTNNRDSQEWQIGDVANKTLGFYQQDRDSSIKHSDPTSGTLDLLNPNQAFHASLRTQK